MNLFFFPFFENEDATSVLVLCWCCAGAVLVLCWCFAGVFISECSKRGRNLCAGAGGWGAGSARGLASWPGVVVWPRGLALGFELKFTFWSPFPKLSISKFYFQFTRTLFLHHKKIHINQFRNHFYLRCWSMTCTLFIFTKNSKDMGGPPFPPLNDKERWFFW